MRNIGKPNYAYYMHSLVRIAWCFISLKWFQILFTHSPYPGTLHATSFFPFDSCSPGCSCSLAPAADLHLALEGIPSLVKGWILESCWEEEGGSNSSDGTCSDGGITSILCLPFLASLAAVVLFSLAIAAFLWSFGSVKWCLQVESQILVEIHTICHILP